MTDRRVDDELVQLGPLRATLQRHLPPTDLQQAVGPPRGSAELGEIDRTHRQGADPGHGHALRVGERDRDPGGARLQADPQLGCAAARNRDLPPGERQLQLLLAADQKRRVQGGIEQSGMDGKAPRLGSLLLGERDLGIDRLPVSPGRGQPLEGGAVLEAGIGEALIETGGLERLGGRGGPGRQRLGRRRDLRAQRCRWH